MAVAVAIAAPNRDEDEGEDEENKEGDDRGDDERLRTRLVEMYGVVQHAVVDCGGLP